MEHSLSYVLVTPYTIAKSRTGGVLSRLLSRLDIELVGAQMFAPDEHFVAEYAKVIRQHPDGRLRGAQYGALSRTSSPIDAADFSW
jgi:hypothetical protein